VRNGELAQISRIEEKKEALAYFGSVFKETTGNKYVPTYGRDYKILGDLLKHEELEEVKRRVDRFFGGKDEWVREKGYTIPIFKSKFNSLLEGGASGKSSIPESLRPYIQQH